ncbi:ETX/MTX2 family pore-forming toxin [Spiroplasma endosymbiont of Tipula paludosa]|uniref:ETX/MTX2 family pore-forming toxin n=1 Tax=Spiroplasma endosymbiont of Tipula paludosa TaxID=3066295 RepID=UPI0035C88108
MKKLLSLLSTITITSSGMTGIVANKPSTDFHRRVVHVGENVNGLTTLNNKVYFGSQDDYLHEYNPATSSHRRVVRVGENVYELTTLNNKIYFGSQDNYLHEYNPATSSHRRVVHVGEDVYGLTTLNNKIYFGSQDDYLHEYNPATSSHRRVVHVGEDVYELTTLNNKIYFGSQDNYLHEYNPATSSHRRVVHVGEDVYGLTTLNNKIYFGSQDNYLHEYNPATSSHRRVVHVGEDVYGLTTLNNKIYFGSQDNYLHEYNPATSSHRRVVHVGEDVYGLTTLNNKIYFGSQDDYLYEYFEPINIQKIILVDNINIINNSNKALLNELNYLNPELDISQIEIINKTNNSIIIKTKNNSNKYFGEKKIYYTIDNNQQNKIIDLHKLIEKGIFLSFRDKNQGVTIKEIKNINTNNLIYSKVTATKNIEPTYTKNSKSICFGTTTLFNNLPAEQNMKTPSCKYTKEATVNSQITTGLSKEETHSQTSDMKNNWSFELGVNVHGESGVWPFAKVSTTIDTKIGTGGEYGSSETKTLSNKFDFSNSKTNEDKEVSEVELPSQEIKVNPNQKIKVTASLDEVFAQVTLNLKQNIYGLITSQIINTYNEEIPFTISIKKIMEKLQQYDLLPQEITINGNDSITFNGKANRSLKQGFNGNIEFHEVK